MRPPDPEHPPFPSFAGWLHAFPRRSGACCIRARAWGRTCIRARALMDGRRLLRRAWGRLGPRRPADRQVGERHVAAPWSSWPTTEQPGRSPVLVAKSSPTDRVTVLPVDQATPTSTACWRAWTGSPPRTPWSSSATLAPALAGGRGDLLCAWPAPARRGLVRRGPQGGQARGGRARPTRPGSLAPRQGGFVAETPGRHQARAARPDPREEQVGDLLAAREPELGVSVLEVRPAGRLVLDGEEASYGPSRADPWPTRLTIPR